MNTSYFEEYTKDCQKISRVFNCLPDFNMSGVFAAWELGGLFGFDEKRGEFWLNVAAHMSVAALLGGVIAEAASAELKKEGLSPRDITETLLVHDWSKRLETSVRKEGVESVARFEKEHKDTLLKWFMEKVVSLTFATGDRAVKIADTRRLSLGERIVFYSDYCASRSRIVSFRQRLLDLLPHFARGGRYQKTDTYYKKRYGVGHHEKLTELLSPIEQEFKKYTGRAEENFPTSLVPAEFCV
ncbi:MAG: hypothetical protein A3D56_03095 [Candidatus Taylorbacteria bacterium RIFCSPHIGHO2_02_FULL_45_35]|uniref:HD domain-containing protein n=1 Tax=Candidatus Taylorbacteria bacterium RIFCSPHIGHO2_02_FULL_45_35 TaxID=1802311 RepID=A0A1G2MRT7_9BACT|nr:MAG: hypothetical protein A3D56_03095 [Candidatus Taylorbacteria bacterium RIFCSPHIGHO2_02_FULL_45_35]